jgi:ankyrin repeat protein
MRVLLRAGADVNQFNNRGETPLHIAVWGKCVSMACTQLGRQATYARAYYQPVA